MIYKFLKFFYFKKKKKNMGSYTVQPGDCLSVIAEMFGTTVKHLLLLNPWINDPDYIQAGWVITVP